MDKQEKIVSMFDEIASTYDVTNRILSMGIDKTWRNKACNLAYRYYGKKEIQNIIDIACGTGDMSDYWQKTAIVGDINVRQITGLDPSANMLELARKKLPNIKFVQGSADLLPFKSSSADLMSISYGLRNVVKRKEALEEFARVLKKDGLLVILEFTKNPKSSLLDYLSDFYLNKILPFLGGLISRNKEAYTYLPNSIEGFLSTQNLCSELKNAGFEVIHTKAFSMNISTLVIAKKI